MSLTEKCYYFVANCSICSSTESLDISTTGTDDSCPYSKIREKINDYHDNMMLLYRQHIVRVNYTFHSKITPNVILKELGCHCSP